MSELSVEHIDRVLADGQPHYFVEVIEAKGSTPRDAGAMMVVGRNNIYGTIGGGSAEWLVINTARGFIDGAEFEKQQIITLGSEIDQCCGGVLTVRYRQVDTVLREQIVASAKEKMSLNVLIFGAGHTGLALADALLPLNANIEIIDTRTQYAGNVHGHNLRCLALPEEAVRKAGGNMIFVITTHDHSLDFLITAEALARGDARYVGMIGSPTKRAVLRSWMGDNHYTPSSIEKLHCPIGGERVKNKQPEVIAAMTVAEILSTVE